VLDSQGPELASPELSPQPETSDEEIIPLEEMERRLILKSLHTTGGNRTKASELLGISVRTLRNKLNEYRQKGIVIPV